MQSPDLAKLLAVPGLTLGDLDDRAVLKDLVRLPVLPGGHPVAPFEEGKRHGALLRVERARLGKLFERCAGVAKVTRFLEAGALFRHPFRAARCFEALLQLRGGVERVEDVPPRVPELLVGQRPPVPVGKAGALGQ